MPAKEQDIVYIGKTNFRGKDRVFGVKTADRRQHMYVVGKTGTGKTTLLLNMVLQDIRAGRGVGVIDPHGEFVEAILGQVPPERTNDVIYFNPVDADYPIGFNVLEVPDQKYKHLVVSDLLGIFTKIWANVWSARMEYILQNSIMALLDTPGTTLLGIPRLLVDKDYRQKIIANVKDPVVKSFWVHEYAEWRDQFRNEAIVPIQNKVNQFLNTSFIRNIVGQPKSTLNIPDIMNSGKILLVNVSKGKIGEDNSALLGAMIITKIQLASMERVRIHEEDRRDFYLYVDEFQNFATDSFAGILSEARKYRLNLILAHQYVGQLVTDISTKVRDAVFGNVGTMIVFRVGAPDGEFLEQEFAPEFMSQDLINLPNYNVYIKLMVDGVTSRPFSATTMPPLRYETDPMVKEKIIRISRERYANPRKEVEEKIIRWSGLGGDAGAGGEGGMFETACWNCGKKTGVPFKPDGRRPAYCLSCMKQIDEGKIVPLHERMPQVGRARYAETLGELGIEFSSHISKSDSRRGAHSTPATRHPVKADFRKFSDSLREIPRREARVQPRPVGNAISNSARPFAPLGETRSSERPAQRVFRTEPVIRASQGVKPISLSALKPKEGSMISSPVPRSESAQSAQAKKPAVDTSSLRQALEEALKSTRKEKPAEPSKLKEKPAEPSGLDVKKDEKIIQPGERVRF